MKLVVTGASGFIGRQLVPRLADAGVEMLLVGREPARLKKLFPAHGACGFADIAVRGAGFDALLHLAVRNNDQGGDAADFHRDIVDLTLDVVRAAQAAGIPRVIHTSTVQVFDAKAQASHYVQAKRKLQSQLETVGAPEVTTLYLPLVYGTQFAGKLGGLNALPGWLQRPVFTTLAALKPTLHIHKLARHLVAGGGDAILTDGQSQNPVFRVLKRSVDIVFGLVVVLGFWWLLAVIWAAVRLTSPGPGIFAQTRVGREGALFTLYKFRTMTQGTRQAGTHDVSADAITRVGHFLRRTKFDELPQVLNILRGELSLIGPRPSLPSQQDLIQERRARDVLDVLPGITGLAQIEGIDMKDPHRLACRDADYIALRCLALEARIAFATARGKGSGDRVAPPDVMPPT